MNTGTVDAANPCDSRDGWDRHWKIVHQAPGIQLYQPVNKTSSGFTAFAWVKWRSAPEKLYQTIWRYDEFGDFIPNVNSSRILHARGHHVWVYQRLHFPGPIRDRHYVMHSTDIKSSPSQGYYRIDWNLTERFPLPEPTDLVSPRVFKGCWDIQKDEDDGLDAIYWIELDPGGWLPRWMIQGAMRRYLTDMLDAIQRKLRAYDSDRSHITNTIATGTGSHPEQKNSRR